MDDILDFTIPAFTRSMWISREVQSRWEPAFQSIRDVYRDLSIRAVAREMLPAALMRGSDGPAAKTRAAELGLLSRSVCMPVPGSGLSAGRSNEAGSLPVLIGRPSQISEAQAALASGDRHAIGRSLGIPDCCASAHAFSIDDRQRHAAIWQMATGCQLADDRLVELDRYEPATNILLAPLRISAIPYVPCSFTCTKSPDVFAAICDSASNRYEFDTLAKFRNILGWPMEWSSRHGIAEIRTPVFKLSCSTIATANSYVVRLAGTGYPDDGAKGIKFPYRSAIGSATAKK